MLRSCQSALCVVGLVACLGMAVGCSNAGPEPSPRAEGHAATPSRSLAIAVAGELCARGNLSARAVRADKSDYPGQYVVRIELTNTASTPCKLNGAQDVLLVGPTDPTWGPAFDLSRWSSDRAPTVILEPGGQAHMAIDFLDDDDNPNPWKPDTVAFNTGASPQGWIEVPWPGGTVLRQDAATHPGTWAGPPLPGATGPDLPAETK